MSMGLTDELREFAALFKGMWTNSTDSVLTVLAGDVPPAFDSIRVTVRIKGIADRIDAEHERQMATSRCDMGDEPSVAIAEEYGKLCDDNAKLRELCKDMWRDFNHDYMCSWEGSCKNPLCKYNGECSYENRMRELGVEGS